MSTELSTSPSSTSWREEDDRVIYFSVVDPETDEVTDVAVLKGWSFLSADRKMKKIIAYAERFTTFNNRKLSKLDPNIARLVREKFTDTELGAMGLLWIVAMTEEISDLEGDPHILRPRRGDDRRQFSTHHWKISEMLFDNFGFAFKVS